MRRLGMAGAKDKDEATREAAKTLFKGLCARLDALSSLHFAPTPVVQDLQVKVRGWLLSVGYRMVSLWDWFN